MQLRDDHLVPGGLYPECDHHDPDQPELCLLEADVRSRRGEDECEEERCQGPHDIYVGHNLRADLQTRLLLC